MEDLYLYDDLLLIILLLIFSWIFLISAQAVIRDHCHRVYLKNKLKLRGMKNEKSLRRTNK